ncbi:putative 14 3 3 protein [Trypanosoma vivax]|uniref:14-3-3 protein-like protein, putative n=1 Tax=Trypanosoma vivax (strain Y486) TaxID=1055687 RepID=F9WLR7_TRYVY|nr:putative 14 3 3 protein [Trypanosoma vivax]CCD18460.1 14-3-3 protein-like protein, putative [Trypanosoma vivax Y486]|eukprot:CCD18460.1 14-3-3 protein-like protein, putative [Trypanosoma vivax Y486]
MPECAKWYNGKLLYEVVPKKDLYEFALPDAAKDLVFMAKLTEGTERYDEIVQCMRKLKMNSELDTEARNLLSMAYKNVIGSRRNAWRIITSIESRESAKEKSENMPFIASLRREFEMELAAVCEDLLGLLDTYVIPASQGGQTKVFYLKMKGDYHRYYAEIAPEAGKRQAALDAYDKATEVANTSLAPTHPIHLGLALNYSVFYYEIMLEHERGIQLARQAYDEAVTGMETLDDETYRESNLILHLLRDDLNLWTDE